MPPKMTRKQMDSAGGMEVLARYHAHVAKVARSATLYPVITDTCTVGAQHGSAFHGWSNLRLAMFGVEYEVPIEKASKALRRAIEEYFGVRRTRRPRSGVNDNHPPRYQWKCSRCNQVGLVYSKRDAAETIRRDHKKTSPQCRYSEYFVRIIRVSGRSNVVLGD